MSLAFLNDSVENNLDKARGFKAAYEILYFRFFNRTSTDTPKVEGIHLLLPCQTLFFKAVELYLRNFLLIKGIPWRDSWKLMNTKDRKNKTGDAHDLFKLWTECSRFDDFPNSINMQKWIEHAAGSEKKYSAVAYSESIGGVGLSDIMIMNILDSAVYYTYRMNEQSKQAQEIARKTINKNTK